MKILKDNHILEQMSTCPICNSQNILNNEEKEAVIMSFKELSKNVGIFKAFRMKLSWDNCNVDLTKYKVTICNCRDCKASWMTDVYIHYTTHSCNGKCV